MNDDPISNKERRKLHAMIRDIAKQVRFDGEWWTPDEWKLFLFAAAFGQRCVKNPFDNRSPVVVNVKRTRSSTVSNAAELITQLYAFGNDRGVEWSDPKWKAEIEFYAEEKRRLAYGERDPLDRGRSR